MKVKALRYKDTKEFVHIEEVFDDEPQIFTSGLPKVQPITATLETIKDYIENNDYFEDLEIDWDRIELVEFYFIELDIIGADIRNKLTPPKNLVSMLEIFFKPKIAHVSEERTELAELIKKEMKQVKKSVDYLAKLL